MHEITIHPFVPADRAACLTIFDSNVPRYFAETERAAFLHHLDRAGGALTPYLILRDATGPCACGGLVLDPAARRAGLSWGMVARGRHGQGLGRRLTEARLAQARAIPGLRAVTLETSQHTRGFYEGFGFSAERIVPEGFGPGLDRVEMILAL